MIMRTRVAAVLVSALLVSLLPPMTATAAVRSDTRSLITVQRVRMIDDAFRPRNITIARGTKVRWRNRGIASHTTTSNTGIWDSGLVAPGDSWGRVFKKAGTFKYHCSVHPTMTGVITVT
jgi:plastocyanin